MPQLLSYFYRYINYVALQYVSDVTSFNLVSDEAVWSWPGLGYVWPWPWPYEMWPY